MNLKAIRRKLFNIILVFEFLNNALIPAIIAAVIAFSILFWKEKKIEPKRLEKQIRIEMTEKRLQCYGHLLSMLRIAKERGKHWKNNKNLHSFVKPYGTQKLELFFQENYYLLSHAVSDEYLKLIEKDTRFGLVTDTSKNNITSQFSIDFEDLEQTASAEYDNLKSHFQSLTGYSFNQVITHD